MKRSKPFWPLLLSLLSLLLVGVCNLYRFSEKLLETSPAVRTVHVIGLSGSAVTCGAALAGVIVVLVARTRPREDQESADKQPRLVKD
jgi:hypothetical protein